MSLIGAVLAVMVPAFKCSAAVGAFVPNANLAVGNRQSMDRIGWEDSGLRSVSRVEINGIVRSDVTVSAQQYTADTGSGCGNPIVSGSRSRNRLQDHHSSTQDWNCPLPIGHTRSSVSEGVAPAIATLAIDDGECIGIAVAVIAEVETGEVDIAGIG